MNETILVNTLYRILSLKMGNLDLDGHVMITVGLIESQSMSEYICHDVLFVIMRRTG